MDAELADCLVFDTTGIESHVAENNPKFLNGKLSQAKSYAKKNPGYDPYRGVYGLMPDAALANNNVKRQYINGHFCYAQKVGILTNGLGIVRYIDLFDEALKAAHPEMPVDKRENDPSADKEIGDSKALLPVLDDFREAHPSLAYSTFLGDAAFAIRPARIPSKGAAFTSILTPTSAFIPVSCAIRTNGTGSTPNALPLSVPSVRSSLSSGLTEGKPSTPPQPRPIFSSPELRSFSVCCLPPNFTTCLLPAESANSPPEHYALPLQSLTQSLSASALAYPALRTVVTHVLSQSLQNTHNNATPRLLTSGALCCCISS